MACTHIVQDEQVFRIAIRGTPHTKQLHSAHGHKPKVSGTKPTNSSAAVHQLQLHGDQPRASACCRCLRHTGDSGRGQLVPVPCVGDPALASSRGQSFRWVRVTEEQLDAREPLVVGFSSSKDLENGMLISSVERMQIRHQRLFKRTKSLLSKGRSDIRLCFMSENGMLLTTSVERQIRRNEWSKKCM